MSDATGCSHPCTLSCHKGCGPEQCSGPPELARVLERFRHEAARGTCGTGRYRMPFYSWGSGPPLVFVHGVSDSSASFLLPIAQLSRHFRCIAYDLPTGRGDGARLRRYTHDHLVEDLGALLDHLGLEQAYLLGSSFGSTVVLRALHAQPARFPRGILQGGLAWRPLRRLERWLARLGRLLPGPTARLPYREKIAWLVNRHSFLRHVSSGAEEDLRGHPLWQFFLECTGRPPIAAFSWQVQRLDALDLRVILPQIRQPVLLFCGELDRVSGRRHEQMLLEGLPSAGRVLIPGCGHVPSYTHPELLAEVVWRFLTPGAWREPGGECPGVQAATDTN